MDEGARAAGAPVDRSPEAIRAQIEQTRAEVGDTVEALAAKTDVKSQAKQKAQQIKDNARARAQTLKTRAQTTTPESAQRGGRQVVARVRARPAPFAIGGAVVLGYVFGRLSGRRGDDWR